MDKGSNGGSGAFPSNGVMAVVLLAAGALLVHEAPLQTNRPPAREPRLEQSASLQDVDARLWQDPFGAVARARVDKAKQAAAPVGNEERDAHSRAKLQADIRKHAQAATAQDSRSSAAVEILAVVLPSEPHPESVETRRRTRYAVLAALNASRLAPADTEHIGYFYPDDPRAADNDAPKPDEDVRKKRDDAIPFEWFEPSGDPRLQGQRRRPPPVLVLSLQADSFEEDPLLQTRRLFDKLRLDNPSTPVHWSVLGPFSSYGLKNLIDKASGWPRDLPIRFYSSNATAPDSTLLPREDKADKSDKNAKIDKSDKGRAASEVLAADNVQLVRTIGDDAELARSLIKELELRGLRAEKLKPESSRPEEDPSEGPAAIADGGEAASAQRRRQCMLPPDGSKAASQVAIVAEWDTLYSRTLRRQFMAREDEQGFCVASYNYVRGLDGYLTGPADSGSDAPSASKQGADDSSKSDRRHDGTFIEVAEGQSQFDYLRRLALQMHEQDRRLRLASTDGSGLRAIGIVGNDAHDKLLVLQALRPEFPDAIFFTTDMDARFLHPREQPWARNLIVASSFGLRLADGPQAGAPPFRSSYQTSTFLATRLALEDARRAPQGMASDDPAGAIPMAQRDINQWLKAPRIFEIGRTGAFDFNGRAPAVYTSAEGFAANCWGPALSKCRDIHPPGSQRYPELPRPVLAFGIFVIVLLLWLPGVLMAVYSRRRDHARDKRSLASEAKPVPWCDAMRRWIAGHKATVVLFGVALIVGQVLLPWIGSGAWPQLAQALTVSEPLVLFEGISLWPTEVIRLVILVLSCYLLYGSWMSLRRNLDDITEEFDSTPARDELIAHQRQVDKDREWWERLLAYFGIIWTAPKKDEKAEATRDMAPPALVFWNQHILQNRLSARAARTVVLVAIALLLSWIVRMMFGEHGFIPYRGVESAMVHDVLRWTTVIAMYFVVFFVVDATITCVFFVRGLRRLREDQANWPDTTVQKFQQQLGLPAEYLDNWIDLRFVALRTRAVTTLIYCPFILISLWLFSRNTLFDRWTIEMGLMIPAATGAAIALVCAVLLRRGAEKSRKHALEQVRDAQIRVNARVAPGSDERAQGEATDVQLKYLQTRIEGLHDGAFAPLWQQPLLKAMLLPFATLGGTTLFDYVALINL